MGWGLVRLGFGEVGGVGFGEVGGVRFGDFFRGVDCVTGWV